MARKQDENVVRPHNYDGIQEYDNALPRWWVGLFVFGIVFAVIYFVAYHVMGLPSLEDEMRSDAHQLSTMQQMAGGSPGTAGDGATEAAGGVLSDRLANADFIAEGKEVYVTNCSPCHGPEGQGLVGPNLVDRFWIHGGSAEAVVKTISDGVPEKGMIAWKPILGQKKVEQSAAFILSLRGTNPANPKPAEGTEYTGQ